MTITTETKPVVATALQAVQLRNALAATLLSVSKDGTLPVLGMVQVEKVGDTLTFRSTDRCRLTVVTVTVKDAPEGDWVTLIPAADVKRAVAALPKNGLDVATVTPDTIGYDWGQASMRFQSFEDDFPKVDQIIPTTVDAVEEIGLKPEQLADLAKMPGRRKNQPAHFKFAGASKPVRVEWTDDKYDNVSYVHLMMPVRVNS